MCVCRGGQGGREDEMRGALRSMAVCGSFTVECDEQCGPISTSLRKESMGKVGVSPQRRWGFDLID